MTMKELMERVGERRFNLVKAYAKDAIAEIEQITKENIDSVEADIEAGKKRYDLPAWMIRLESVKILDVPSGRYYAIPRIRESDLYEVKE